MQRDDGKDLSLPNPQGPLRSKICCSQTVFFLFLFVVFPPLQIKEEKAVWLCETKFIPVRRVFSVLMITTNH